MGCFDDVAEFPLAGKLIHERQMMFHGEVCEPVHSFIGTQQNRVAEIGDRLHFAGEIDIGTEGDQVALKILQTAVDQLIPAPFCRIDIFQLLQDHIKSIMEGKNHRLFLPVYKTGFAADIRVDQAQRFSRKGIQFQIPGGMI